jgi:hypothetical protein
MPSYLNSDLAQSPQWQPPEEAQEDFFHDRKPAHKYDIWKTTTA